MQPIAPAFRRPGVVRALTDRDRPVRPRWRPGKLTSVVLAGAFAVTAWVGFYGESLGSAPPGAVTGHPRSAPFQASAAAPASPGPAIRSARPASPCLRNTRSQLIVVSIEQQHEWACAGRRTVLSTAVTTGAERPGDATPRGMFAIQGLNRNTNLTTNRGRSYRVKYWLPFHLGVWGFHDASWQKMPFGSKHYVTHGSHGCVHMPLAAIRWLFHWVHYGTPVRIT